MKNNSESELVTVVMSAYNHENYVRAAMESVLSQSHENIEFLVTDDGSRDGTVDAIRGIHDHRIRFSEDRKNRGACTAINGLIKQASGKFICMMNSDDIWTDRDKIRKQLDVLKSDPSTGVCFGIAGYINEHGEELKGKKTEFPFEKHSRGGWLRRFFFEGNSLCHPSMMIRRECYENVGYYNNLYRQLPDYDFWIRICKKYGITVLNEKLIAFRIVPGKNTSSPTSINCVRDKSEQYIIRKTFFDEVSHEDFVEGFHQHLTQKKVLDEEVLSIEKTLIYFSKQANNSNINALIGLEKMAKLMEQPSIRERLSSTYGIDDHWMHGKSGEMELFNSTHTVVKTIKTRPRILRYLKNHRVNILKSLKRVKDGKTGTHLKIKDHQIDNSAQNITEIKNTELNKTQKTIDQVQIPQIRHKGHILKRFEVFIRKKKRKVLGNISKKNNYIKVLDSELIVEAINLPRKPLISVIMPCYNSDLKWLREAIDSVTNQAYQNWELCIADDASTDPGVQKLLKEYSSLEERIKVTRRLDNGHIAEASNSALSMANGEWVTFLDHDDAISQNALLELVKSINENPRSRLIYSDEDKIDENGNRFDHHFKSDWNPDLFFSQNYICHLTAIHASVINKVNGFRTGVDGSQDYDLILRCLKHLGYDQIYHIPKILYHWRAITGSTALDTGEKDYASEAGIRSLRNYFQDSNKKIKVTNGPHPTTYKVNYPIPNPEPLVSIIIPTKDKLELLSKCINSIIQKTSYKNYEILIIDNNSENELTTKYLNDIKKRENLIKVVSYKNEFNYSLIQNFAVDQCSGSLICLLNNDIEVISPSWLDEMVSHALRPEIGCVGAKLYYSDGRIQHGGVILGIGGVAGHSHKHFPKDHPGYFGRLQLVQNLSAVTAACLVIRKSIFWEVGGFEEQLRIAFNDVDYCLKVREAGYRNLWTPYAELYHHESASRGYEDTPEKVARFNSEVNYMIQKWGDKLLNDRYYNINLTLKKEDFDLK